MKWEEVGPGWSGLLHRWELRDEAGNMKGLIHQYREKRNSINKNIKWEYFIDYKGGFLSFPRSVRTLEERKVYVETMWRMK